MLGYGEYNRSQSILLKHVVVLTKRRRNKINTIWDVSMAKAPVLTWGRRKQGRRYRKLILRSFWGFLLFLILGWGGWAFGDGDGVVTERDYILFGVYSKIKLALLWIDSGFLGSNMPFVCTLYSSFPNCWYVNCTKLCLHELLTCYVNLRTIVVKQIHLFVPFCVNMGTGGTGSQVHCLCIDADNATNDLVNERGRSLSEAFSNWLRHGSRDLSQFMQIMGADDFQEHLCLSASHTSSDESNVDQPPLDRM